MHKIFSFGEILKDVHLRGMSLEEISSISPKEIGLLSKSGKIVSADDEELVQMLLLIAALLEVRLYFLQL